MVQSPKDRARAMIYGALIADAATMGLHWIYDQDHILKIAPENPEFRTPSADDYANVRGYFAHEGRKAGEQSQYGEQLLVMLRALAAHNGQYSPGIYADHFRKTFGYGGTFVGYIDHSTRDTLDNFRRAEDEALRRARDVPFNGEASVTNAMVTKALSLIKQASGKDLENRFAEAVRITHDDDVIVAYGFNVLDEIMAMKPTFGAIDEQHPAVSKLPALLAICKTNSSLMDDQITDAAKSAIRLTSNHDNAIAYGLICTKMLETALDGQTPDEIIASGLNAASGVPKMRISSAIALTDKDASEVTRQFGLACDLSYGVPNIAHNIITASSYSDAIRRNIYAGGDNCGRAMILGAVMGAHYGMGGDAGIPQAWLDKLHEQANVDTMLDMLL